MTVGTHQVTVTGTDNTAVDISCLVDSLTINHGRADTQSQPVAASATLALTVGPDEPLPVEADIGAALLIETVVGGTAFTRFRGAITDVSVGWDDAGEDTPEAGIGQIVAAGSLADFGRRLVGDEPWPEELDGARVARVFELAGAPLDPGTSDPGLYAVIPRDVDRRNALEVAQNSANSAGGLVWYTRDGEIRYADADHRRGTVVQLDLNACDVLVTPTWQRNTAGLVNEVSLGYGVAPEGGEAPRVTAVNEPSMQRFGRHEYTATVELADDSDAAAAAAEIVGMNGFPVWILQAMPVDVAALSPAVTQTLLGLEVHGLLRVAGLPETGQTPTDVAAWIEGWTETLAWGVHELELAVSDYCRTAPPPRWNDIPSTQLWDGTDAGLTWDGAACLGPPPNLGIWDHIPATTRWEMVDPALAWDDAAGGVQIATLTT